MTEAMQITVSSEIANRIDDSSSTAARSAASQTDFNALGGRHGRR
jgi:hypothetical protein